MIKKWQSPGKKILHNPLCFIKQVIRSFQANQGLLLSGAVAYYTLLSIIPLFSLILIALSYIVEPDQLLQITSEYINLVLPGQASIFIEQITRFTTQKHIGWLLLLILLFFSSMTFTVLENTMSIIFFHRVSIQRRHFLISAIIPYCYIIVLGLGMLMITTISGVLQVWEGETISILFWSWTLDGMTKTIFYILGVTGLILMLTSIYMVMPVGKLSFKHALIGSISATFLWEIARHILVWYFSTLSMVNVVYGSLTSAIVVLLFLEVGAIILLFGAQVIAEYERIGYGESCQGCDDFITNKTDTEL
ncbi:MAG: YihY family inner membrane protein [Gammaproteobacteria bacterium]|nr:YihY family inner membrane protein [Gammaproteobacteria bacterium]